MRRGFFVPKSTSGEYVASQKTGSGAYRWDQAASEVGLGQQAALATLNKQYSTTINNAYTNYLTASRGIRGSTMGEGYKEAYKQHLNESLAAETAEINLSAGQARMELAQQGMGQLQSLDAMFQAELGNMNRVSSMAEQYLKYLGSLNTLEGKSYLTEEQLEMSLDNMYDAIFSAQPRGYYDERGEGAMPYLEWLRANLKDTEADRAWSDWAFNQGGLSQFQRATKRGIKKT